MKKKKFDNILKKLWQSYRDLQLRCEKLRKIRTKKAAKRPVISLLGDGKNAWKNVSSAETEKLYSWGKDEGMLKAPKELHWVIG